MGFDMDKAVQRAGLDGGLVGDDAGDHPLDARKAHDDVFRPVFLHFQEIALVHDAEDHF